MRTAIVFLTLCAALGAKPFCTTHDISGNYAFLANGLVLGTSPISGPFSRVGTMTADGRGGVHFSTLALYNGINFGLESFSGTYSVNSDCTVNFHIAVPQPVNTGITFKGQVAEGGDDVTFILTNSDSPQTVPPNTTVVGFARQRQSGRCSTKDIDGTWRIEINGFRNLPPLGSGTPYRQLGQMVLNGSGGLTGSLISSNNGSISAETAVGTYTVASDCTFDLNYTIAGAPYGIHGSVISSTEMFVGLNMPGPTQEGVGILTSAVATGKMVLESNFPDGHGGDDHHGDDRHGDD